MTFSAVLLAGGESRRMGKDKATIVFKDRPLWERQLRILLDLDPEEIFISARNSPAWLPHDAKLLLDEPPSRGPLSGLTEALSAIRTSHLIVLAVDMPFMTIEQIRSLLGRVLPESGIVPIVNERAEPLAAIYPRSAALAFTAAITGNDFSLQPIVEHLVRTNKVQLVQVSAKERDLYRSVNEPADLERA